MSKPLRDEFIKAWKLASAWPNQTDEEIGEVYDLLTNSKGPLPCDTTQLESAVEAVLVEHEPAYLLKERV